MITSKIQQADRIEAAKAAAVAKASGASSGGKGLNDDEDEEEDTGAVTDRNHRIHSMHKVPGVVPGGAKELISEGSNTNSSSSNSSAGGNGSHQLTAGSSSASTNLAGKYTRAQLESIRGINVLTYSAEEAQRSVAEVAQARELLDPLGGATTNTSSAATTIPLCTEDMVCDLEEMCVAIRAILRKMTVKVSYMLRCM